MIVKLTKLVGREAHGTDFADYVKALVKNPRTQPVFERDMQAFFGPHKAKDFTGWLWAYLGEVIRRVKQSDPTKRYGSPQRRGKREAIKRDLKVILMRFLRDDLQDLAKSAGLKKSGNKTAIVERIMGKYEDARYNDILMKFEKKILKKVLDKSRLAYSERDNKDKLIATLWQNRAQLRG